MKQEQRKKGSRYALTGLMVNVSLFFVLKLLLVLGIDYRVSVTIIYILGVLWGYAQNRLWSWRSDAPVIRSVSAYILTCFAIYLIHLGIVTLLVGQFSVQALYAAVLSAVLLIGPNFILLDRFVFRTPASRS